MTNPTALPRRDELGFKGNLADTRYGWLRLTPAYSLALVRDRLAALDPRRDRVLDPFCGTGTTALACAERGLRCDTTEINPFLVWLAAAKARRYRAADLRELGAAAEEVDAAIRRARPGRRAWTPPLFRIERWWDPPTLAALAAAMEVIRRVPAGGAGDLLRVAFCRVVIARAHVSFGHQSMSFRTPSRAAAPAGATDAAADAWGRAVASIAAAAASPVARPPRVLLADARDLAARLPAAAYTCVVTSPPYPNRMSYVRELRPYMYWLGFLGEDAREAGELDWRAIGGTWGCATSNVARWEPPAPREVPYPAFDAILARIGRRSPLLSRYVHRYFHDMVGHVAGLHRVVAPGGAVHYVVGNSKFYDVLLPVEALFGALLEAAGFGEVRVEAIRKRSSKKELFEYVVSARKPAAAAALTGHAARAARP